MHFEQKITAAVSRSIKLHILTIKYFCIISVRFYLCFPWKLSWIQVSLHLSKPILSCWLPTVLFQVVGKLSASKTPIVHPENSKGLLFFSSSIPAHHSTRTSIPPTFFMNTASRPPNFFLFPSECIAPLRLFLRITNREWSSKLRQTNTFKKKKKLWVIVNADLWCAPCAFLRLDVQSKEEYRLSNQQ